MFQHEYELGNHAVQPGSLRKKAELEPGTAYRFRVAGINACGRGEWSEVRHVNKISSFSFLFIYLTTF